MRKILLPILLLATRNTTKIMSCLIHAFKITIAYLIFLKVALCKDFNTYIVNPANMQGEEAKISAADLI